MAETYLTYATEVSNALERLLDTTGVTMRPDEDFVSCSSGLAEHFVPAGSLETHLYKCHGEKKPRPILNSAFYYRSSAARQKRGGVARPQLEVVGDDQEEGAEDRGEQRSLLEPESSDVEDVETEKTTHGQGIVKAIKRASLASAGEFYARVQSWQKIPRAYAAMTDSERDLVTPVALRSWINAELSRPGVFPNGDALDEELGQFVAGLLDHPDFCQPDLLALELHEFLGTSATGFVLALWKFMMVEIGLQSVFKDENDRVNNKFQEPTRVYEATAQEAPQHPYDTATTISERDYKRRRASYRGKIGSKTGIAALREMIQKHMIGLSLESGRNLVRSGENDGETTGDKHALTTQLRPEGMEWYRFTDALDVRNRSRSRSTESMRSRERSCSLSRGRLVQRNMHRDRQRHRRCVDRSERGHHQKRGRSRSQDRRRSHQRDLNSYPINKRKRSASPSHNRQRAQHSEDPSR